VDGLGEVHAGDDLAGLLSAAAELRDGDILVVTSKVVSKAEDRVRHGDRAAAVEAETDRTLARRGATSIVRTRHGLVMAAAGVDASNTAAGTVVLLPLDPDASARRLRETLLAATGRNVGVVVTDTAGRAWRTGQTDIAVGAAGVQVVRDYAGAVDPHGNELAVTAPALADEVAAAADLVKRKLDRRPAAVVRGLADLVLPAGSHGAGAAALVRPETEDLFGLGAREAVLTALRGQDARGFGAPASPAELVEQLGALAGPAVGLLPSDAGVAVRLGGTQRERGADEARLTAAALALGWRVQRDGDDLLRLAPAGP
jgi:coenzyme F420-0:L-glutamate ligase/coenzyme F420-1:gamma-L-glutamate ligase